VQGNVIGLSAAGSPLGNSRGIVVQNANNLIGGTTAAARNIISGNASDGLTMTSATATGNVVQGNYIGTDAAGLQPAAVLGGLVSWYKAEGNFTDSAGTNPGTGQGGVSFAVGEVGQGFQFDGTTAYVDLGNNASLDTTGSESVAAWVKVTSLNLTQ